MGEILDQSKPGPPRTESFSYEKLQMRTLHSGIYGKEIYANSHAPSHRRETVHLRAMQQIVRAKKHLHRSRQNTLGA